MSDESINKGYEKLAIAIVRQACKDYRNALRDHDKKEIKEIENFFLGSLYKKIFPQINGEHILRMLKQNTGLDKNN